jgi:hypothetical protein
MGFNSAFKGLIKDKHFNNSIKFKVDNRLKLQLQILVKEGAW